MTDVRIRQVHDLTGQTPLCEEIALCWLDVSNAGGAVGFPFPPVSIDQVRRATERLALGTADGTVLTFVAEVDDKVVGWVSLRINGSALTQHWATVERLQSRPESRRQGVGRQLMDTLAAHAQSIGLEQLRLVLRGGENLEGFYLRLGWKEIGRHRDALRLEDGDRDEVSMLLDLPANRPSTPRN